jgi:hypothetical protein
MVNVVEYGVFLGVGDILFNSKYIGKQIIDVLFRLKFQITIKIKI